jgi:hypothetical protein
MSSQNGSDALAAAIGAEQQVAREAEGIRGEVTEITPTLLVKLLPLLRKPIPQGFIKSIGAVTGKPYASTGVTSVQVQHNRMNNVLTPLWWWEKVSYHEDGKLAHVRVGVGEYGERPLFTREAWGGVDRASTIGNLHKGSYTNAAKLAFARVGPGHEVYIGATDLDPDVNEQAAKEQARPAAPAAVALDSAPRRLTEEEIARIVTGMEKEGYADEDQMMLLSAVGVTSSETMTTADAFELRALMDERKARQ